MPSYKNRVGDRYGRLLVISEAERSEKRKGVRWINLKLPIHWKIGKKTEFLGMNFYRNAHFRTLSKLKIEYTNSLSELRGKRLKTPISITYVFHPSRSDQDMDNCISVSSKFLQDSLVHYGVIEGDTYQHISLTTNIAGEKDKEGFIEVCIEEI